MNTTTYKTYLDFATGKAIHKKARKRTKAHITPMKESSLTANDNIISKDLDATLKLAKSMSRTEAEEHEAARLVHETHERLITDKPTRRRKETSVVFRDTLVVSTKKTPTQSLKLKGMEILSDAAMLDDVNMEMKDAEPADEDIGDEEMIDVKKEATTDTPATQREKLDVPPSSSSRFVSSNYGSIFLNLDNLSFAETKIISMLDVQHRVSDLEKEVKKLKQVNLSTILRASIRSDVPPAINEYLGSSLGDAL
ncbi:hypothetical protein Tco_0276424 [Tanacetum coccineum]